MFVVVSECCKFVELQVEEREKQKGRAKDILYNIGYCCVGIVHKLTGCRLSAQGLPESSPRHLFFCVCVVYCCFVFVFVIFVFLYCKSHSLYLRAESIHANER